MQVVKYCHVNDIHMWRVTCLEGHQEWHVQRDMYISGLTCKECHAKSDMSRVTGQEWQL